MLLPPTHGVKLVHVLHRRKLRPEFILLSYGEGYNIASRNRKGKDRSAMIDIVNEASPAGEGGLIRIVVAVIVYVGLLGVLVGYLLWKLPRGADKSEKEKGTDD